MLRDRVLEAGQIAAALAAILGLVAALFRYTARRFSSAVSDIVAEQLDPIQRHTVELVPNGGSSMRDAVNRLEARQLEVVAETRALREALTEHLAEHRRVS